MPFAYLYVYVSNESQGQVYFDDLKVDHLAGPLMEETHYYPFGLTMAGISSKAVGIVSNKEKTFQGQRFDEDFGLNWVQFKWRNHDPQIGRFIEVDPLANDYVHNSTYAFSENKVTGHIELEGLESVDIRYYQEQGIRITEPNASEGDIKKVMEAVDNGRTTGGVAALRTAKFVGILALMIFQPEIGFPLAVADLTGVPVTPSPAAISTTSVATVEISLEQRANDIHGVQGVFAQSKTTTAVGTGLAKNGEQMTMVASSNARLSPAQRAALNSNETAVSNKTLGIKGDVKIHAEQKITQYAAQNGITVGEIAASRPICPGCEAAINSAGARAGSALKVLPPPVSAAIPGIIK